MKLKRRNQISIALSAGVLATLAMLPSARAELVYEPEVSPNAPADVRADDRANTRQALQASQNVQSTLQASAPPMQTAVVPVAVQVQPQVQVAPVQQQPMAQQQMMVPVQQAPLPQQQAIASDPQPEVQSLSKTELMRRERTREELKNEDLLQERLEELRLRDEKRRTDELLGQAPANNADGVQPIQGLANGQAPQSEVVVSPVTAHPGVPSQEVAPIPTAAQAQQYSQVQSPYTPAAQAQMAGGASMATAAVPAPSDNQSSQFYLGARGGISSMNISSNLSGMNVTGLYSLGLDGGVMISDNMALEVGYMYSSYGITLGQMYTLPGVSQYSYTLNQNVFDADLKFYVLGPDSRVRPFVIGGGGYAMSYLNYPSQMTAAYPYLNNQSYSSNAFLGEIGAGLDIRVNKTISIGAMFKFNDALSSNNSNNQLQYYNGPGGATAQQAVAGASLQQSSFYTITAGVNFAL